MASSATAVGPAAWVQFVARLRRQAFSELDVSRHRVDLQGWVNEGFEGALARLREHLGARDPRAAVVVVEVGSWKGASTSRIAECLKGVVAAGRGSLVAVDTWLGAPEFYTWGLEDPTRGGALAPDRGFPTVFHTFTKNIKALGHDDVVAPFPLSSHQAAEVLGHVGLSADALYLDASHEYEAVAQDLRHWFPVVREGGMLWGDDYAAWPGVGRAVDEFAALHALRLEVIDSQWIMWK